MIIIIVVVVICYWSVLFVVHSLFITVGTLEWLGYWTSSGRQEFKINFGSGLWLEFGCSCCCCRGSGWVG